MEELDSNSEKRLIERFEAMLNNHQSAYFDSEELVEIAEYYIDFGDYKKAERAIHFGQNLFPGNYFIQLKKIECHILTQKPKQAWELIKPLFRLNSDDCELLILTAKVCSMQNRHHMAIKILTRSLEYASEKDEIFGLIGMEYYNLAKYRKALYYFKRSASINPENELDFQHALLCFQMMKEKDKAIDFVDQFLDNMPFSEIAWFELGRLYKQKNEFDRALIAFDYAFLLNEENKEYCLQKGMMYEKMKKHHQAIENYLAYIEHNENDPMLLMKIGKCYKTLGEKEQAFKFFFQSVREDPQYYKAWNEIAVFHKELENYREALKYTNRALEFNPNNTSYLSRKVSLCIHFGFYEEAQETLEKLTELKTDDPNIWIDYVYILITLGEYEDALKTVNDGLSLFDHNGELYINYAFLLFKFKKQDKALQALNNAYKYSGNETVALIKKQYPSFYKDSFFQSWIQSNNIC